MITVMRIILTILAFFLVYRLLKIQDASVLQRFLKVVEKKEVIGGRFQKYENQLKRLNLPANRFVFLGLFGFGLVVSGVVYRLMKEFFVIDSVAYIVAIPCVFAGFALVTFAAERKVSQMEAGLNDFLIQFKAALRVNNEITEAFRRIQNGVTEPFQSYLKKMLNEINSGKLPEQALRDFADRVGIEKFRLYVEHLRFCQVYGGDVLELTERTQEMISAAIREKKKRNRETNDVCKVLYLLIAIDLFMFKSFVMGNEYYFHIMTRNWFGMGLVNLNFISIWLMVLLSKFIRKLDY